jgi:hypothetical protein
MKSGLLSERIIYARIQSHKKENKPVITFETRTQHGTLVGFTPQLVVS